MKHKKILGISLILVTFALAATIITLTVVPLITDVSDKHEPIMSYATYKTSENNKYVLNNTDSSSSSNSSYESVTSLPANESSIFENSITNPVSSGIVNSSASIIPPHSSVSSSNTTSKNIQNNISSGSSYSVNTQNGEKNNGQVTQSETTTEITNNTVPEHIHNYIERIVSPTCTARGYTIHTCDCGNSYADNYKSALGHSWSDWETISEATTTSKGLQQRTCLRCSAKDYKYINEIKVDNSSNSEFAKKVVELVNEERKNNNLPALKIDNTLMQNAYTRSTELETNFGHQRPNGEMGYQFAINLGYSTVGENIAAGQESPEAVVKSWMSSAGHRANILNPEYTHIGVGCYTASDGWIYWAQLFGG